MKNKSGLRSANGLSAACWYRLKRIAGKTKQTLLMCFIVIFALGVFLVPQRYASAVTLGPGSIATDLNIADNEYSKYYYEAAKVHSGFNGTVASCNAGQTSDAYKNAYVSALNYIRSLVGLTQPIVYNPDFTESAQQAALIMSANQELSHDPPRDWKCWSESGHGGAGSSNLTLQHEDTVGYSLELYLSDPGDTNKRVGHRNSLLRQSVKGVSVGSTHDSQAVSVQTDWSAASTLAATAWPSAGYFPSVFIPPSKRWSFTYYSPADFQAAQVRMWKNDQPIDGSDIQIVSVPDKSRYGETLVWELSKFVAPIEGAVDKWTVEVSGIYDLTASSTIDYNYDVLVFPPTMNLPAPIGLPIEHPALNLTNVTGPFVDLTKDESRNQDINWLAGVGVTVGCKNENQANYYCPSSPVNRGSMAEFLHRMSGAPDLTLVPSSHFQDLSNLSYDRIRAIDWLYATKITVGCTKVNFCPANAVNRGAMAEFLYRFAGSPNITKPHHLIVDIISLDSSRQNAVKWMASEKITILDSHKYRPWNVVNRGSMAQFLHRLAIHLGQTPK
ncbi:MAG: CAP domain-containing protein [Bifidobacteriaceae bacterium]|jgi:hypothetical protein|nr:CAP domain-containing protein [Bifidobacteriaceae bacterium]